MSQQFVTLREASAQLGIPPHVIVYTLVSGKVQEPLRISGRRMFTVEDIHALRTFYDRQLETRWGRRGNEAPDPAPRPYSLADAARLLGVGPEIVLKALSQLPALNCRSGAWTIEDLSSIDAVLKAMVPQLARKEEL